MKDFFFSIPLQGKKSDEQWNMVSSLLQRTLKSIFNQTDDKFTVMIAGHDRPSIAEIDDHRVKWLQAQYNKDNEGHKGPQDKHRKRRLTLKEVSKRGGGFVAMLDADDLIRKDLVETAKYINDPNGYLLVDGYVLDHRKNLMADVNKVFGLPYWKVCGSCAVFNFTPEDIFSNYASSFKSHGLWAEQAASANRPLKELPDKMGVYVLNNSVNDSDRYRIGPKADRILHNIEQYADPSIDLNLYVSN